MKYIFCIAIFCIAGVQFTRSQPVQRHGQLKVKGTFILDQHNDTIVLRGMSYGWHNWWPRFYNKKSVKWLHEDWGCHVVRAAMGVGVENGYTEKPEWSVKTVSKVIDGAIREGIYVIIDWHSHETYLDEAKRFFSEMAKKYGENPHVIYEIFNEPVEQSWPEIKNYSTEVIKAIRQYDPDNIILVGSPHWNQDLHLVADNPITGYDNIMYTLHFYAATHKDELRNKGTYALDKNIPLFVSESAGMEANGDGDIDYEEWNKWINWMEANKISWILWSITDKDETCSVLKPSASSNGQWKKSDLKESGIESRKLIRSYQQED